jgi:NADPH:quinone reductase-like Zn-dependent oxidoreductase
VYITQPADDEEPTMTAAAHSLTDVLAPTMHAIVQDRYGPPEVLRFAEVATPSAGPGEVLVRVRAASIDAGTGHLMTGLPYLARPAFGIRRPRVRTPGLAMAGVVEAVGPSVTDVRRGDEVIGLCTTGAFAEYAAAKAAGMLVPKPAGLSFEAASTLPISAVTALQAVRDHGEVEAGHRVLVTGAGGGVGSFAVQVARAYGAEVTGVCGPQKVDMVRSIGAEHVIDYTVTDFTAGEPRYDVIIDTAGRRSLSRMRRALTPDGTLVVVGGEGGGRFLGGFPQRIVAASLLSIGGGRRLRGFISPDRREDLAAVVELVQAGEVTPCVDRTFALADARQAMALQATGTVRGKLVLTV